MNKTRLLKPGLLALILTATVPLGACSALGSKSPTAAPNTAAVTKGDITTFITASGNLSYPDTQDVRFEIGGTVSEVLVQAGDMVKQGDTLVKLDDGDIQDNIKTIQVNIQNQQLSLEKVADKYKQLIYPYTYKTFAVDIPDAVVSLQAAQRKVDDARVKLSGANGADETATAAHELLLALQDLDDATVKLTFGQGDGIFTRGATGSLTNTNYWTLRSAQLDVEAAQAQLDKVNNDLANAQSDLDKTLVKAPFDGLITDAPVKDGAIINKGNVAITMTNPSKLEADILVNEIDIFNVKVGGTANVQVDAANSLTVPAAVTYIEPTATIQSGVVNFNVKVELNQPAAGNATPPESPAASPARNNAGAPGAVSYASLRQGLSVTVNILKDARKGVLLVPNRAVTRQGTSTTVQVLKDDGTVETVTVKTGITDNKNTEITEGLSEGEKVIIQATRVATPATGGGLFGGGARGPVVAPGR